MPGSYEGKKFASKRKNEVTRGLKTLNTYNGIHKALKKFAPQMIEKCSKYEWRHLSIVMNLLWNATPVPALEVSLLFTGRTVLGLLVRTVTAIVLAVAEEPLRNTTIVSVTCEEKNANFYTWCSTLMKESGKESQLKQNLAFFEFSYPATKLARLS